MVKKILNKGETIGLVIGSGDLAKSCINMMLLTGYNVQIIKLPCCDISVNKNLDQWNLRYEKIDEIFLRLKEKSINKIAMIGHVIRPNLNLNNFNSESLKIFKRIIPCLSKGDNSLFLAIKNEFENHGLIVLKVNEVVNALTLSEGSYGYGISDYSINKEIDEGFALFKEYSLLDLGQSLVFHKGHCLGLETLSGTDYMLRGLIDFRENSKIENEYLKKGGFLIKAPKVKQILEIDVPSIGPGTVHLMKKARLDGLVLQSNKVLIAEKEEVLNLVKENKMFLIVKNFIDHQ